MIFKTNTLLLYIKNQTNIGKNNLRNLDYSSYSNCKKIKLNQIIRKLKKKQKYIYVNKILSCQVIDFSTQVPSYPKQNIFLRPLLVSESADCIWMEYSYYKKYEEHDTYEYKFYRILCFQFESKQKYFYDYEYDRQIDILKAIEKFDLLVSGGLFPGIVLHNLTTGATLRIFKLQFGTLIAKQMGTILIFLTSKSLVLFLDLQKRRLIKRQNNELISIKFSGKMDMFFECFFLVSKKAITICTTRNSSTILKTLVFNKEFSQILKKYSGTYLRKEKMITKKSKLLD